MTSNNNTLDTSLRYLFVLTSKQIITNSAITVYAACYLNQSEEIPVSKLVHMTKLSQTIVRHHLATFEMMGLMSIERHQGKPLNIEVHPLTRDLAKSIVHDDSLISNIKQYRDVKINNYNLKKININNINIKEEGSVQVQELFALLPAKYQSFRMTPHYRKQLEILSADLELLGSNIKHYARWFVAKKLGKTVKSFGLGIFIYPGMVEEYKQTLKKESYKHVSSRKASFEQAAAKLEEELRGK